MKLSALYLLVAIACMSAAHPVAESGVRRTVVSQFSSDNRYDQETSLEKRPGFYCYFAYGYNGCDDAPPNEVQF